MLVVVLLPHATAYHDELEVQLREEQTSQQARAATLDYLRFDLYNGFVSYYSITLACSLLPS